MDAEKLYSGLRKHYGEQKWWPSSRGFKPPELEICLGAILTQNTNWKNVEKALDNLKAARLVTPKAIAEIPTPLLELIIKPSGFFRQKAERVKIFLEAVRKKGGVKKFLGKVSREELLGLKGIGPETADSILLYAGNRPFFVVDLYTKRLLQRMGLVGNVNYQELQEFFSKKLPEDSKLFKEFHALVVEHSKEFCRAKPSCKGCPLGRECLKKL